MVVAPATANTINKFASGIADDLLTTCFLAHDFKKPFLVAPAMNHHMYHHPVTQESIQKLLRLGINVLPVGQGTLACQETGDGRMLEPEDIFSRITQSLGSPIQKGKILVTGGGTREPIDSVRYIGNRSTGSTAAQIADHLASNGYEVFCLISKYAEQPKAVSQIKHFESHNDLDMELKKILGFQDFDAVVHLAAVSDFTLEPQAGKISSQNDVILSLKKTEKIIDKIKSWSKNPKTKIIGFKLTVSTDAESMINKVRDLIHHSNADLVIQNDLNFISKDDHQFKAFGPNLKPVFEGSSKHQLCIGLTDWIQKNVEVNL
jgi:phosphopantothenoylcysteine decarboxylase/phosphopantothenate--cysteine ligase